MSESSSSSSSAATSNGVVTFFSTYKDQIITLIVGSLSFVTALAINGAVTSTLDTIYPPERRGHLDVKYLYAIIVLLVAAMIILILSFMKTPTT